MAEAPEDATGQRVRTVLFLCTGNSCRSIVAEAILNRMGEGRFEAYSAGSQPAGMVNPFAIELLERLGHPTERLRSKSWDEFSGPDAPRMDFIITVCDSATGETCPVWPGQPMTAHWGIPDPAMIRGSNADKRLTFRRTHELMRNGVGRLLTLPIDALDPERLRRQLAAIGRSLAERAGASPVTIEEQNANR